MGWDAQSLTPPIENRRQACAQGSAPRWPPAREDHFDRSKQPSEQARPVLQRGSALLGQSLRQGGQNPSAQPRPRGRLPRRGPCTAVPAERRGLPNPPASSQQPAAPDEARPSPPAAHRARPRSTHRALRGSSGCSPALGRPGPRSSPPPTPGLALTHQRVAPGHPASHGRPVSATDASPYLLDVHGSVPLGRGKAPPQNRNSAAAGSGEARAAPSGRAPYAPARSPVGEQNGGGRGGGACEAGGTTLGSMQIAGGVGASLSLSRRKDRSPAALLGGLNLINYFLSSGLLRISWEFDSEEPCSRGWPVLPPYAGTMVVAMRGEVCSAPKPRVRRAEPITERAGGHVVPRPLKKDGLSR